MERAGLNAGRSRCWLSKRAGMWASVRCTTWRSLDTDVDYSDMATHNRFSGTGGLDGSLQFELRNGENTGPGHNTTLQFYSHYLSSRASLADLIAAGAYASVRACGGPVIPLRMGRVDATGAGS